MWLISLLVFCFFKQNTAYEMRISDWSSDVCSSDLQRQRRSGNGADRPDPGEEAPELAQVHLRRNLAAVRIAHLWQPHGTEQHGVRRRGRLEGRLVERDAPLAVDQGAGFQRGEVQLEAAHGTAGGSQNAEARSHHLGADGGARARKTVG